MVNLLDFDRAGLAAFFAEVKELAALDKAQRASRLKAAVVVEDTTDD